MQLCKLKYFIILFLFVGMLSGYAQTPDEISTTVKNMVSYLKDRSVAVKISIGSRAGFGSGAIISADGLILTCAHVAEVAPNISIITSSGQEFTATKLGMNSVNDYALLKIDAKNLPFFPLGDSSKLELLEWVIAVGHPGGPYPDNQPSIATGRIRALHRRLPIELGAKFYDDAIQTDSPIFAGNSGGPLVNLKGELIGINGAIMLVSDLAFSIPINEMKADFSVLKKGRDVAGRNPESIFEVFKIMMEMQEEIPVQDMQKMFEDTPLGRILKTFGGDVNDIVTPSPLFGVEFKMNNSVISVTHVSVNSVGALAGLKPGDIIVNVAGKKITSLNLIRSFFANVQFGEQIDIVILRNGQRKTLTAIFNKHAYSRDQYLKNHFIKEGLMLNKSTVKIISSDKLIGYGAAIDPNGWILTSFHILPKNSKVALEIPQQPGRYPAEIVGWHEIYDIALLKINPKIPMTALEFGNDRNLNIGNWVISGAEITGCMQVGMVSAVQRNIPDRRRVPPLGLFGMLGTPNKSPVRAYLEVIQHDSNIEKHQFGTPLINLEGKLIGINVGHFYRGTTLATPISLIKAVLAELKSGKNTVAGPEYQPYEPELDPMARLMQYFLAPDADKKENFDDILRDVLNPKEKGFIGVQLGDHESGAEVVDILKDSPAEKAGIKVGDVVISVDGQKLMDMFDLIERIQNMPPGTQVRLGILRSEGLKEKEIEITVTLGQRPK